MIFSSITTIFFFLPIVMLGYFILYKLTKKNTLILNIYLCLVSLIFYWWGDNDNYNTKIILLLILVNYFFSYIIRTNTNVYAKRLSAIIAVAFDCIMLIRYKYPDIILTGGSIDNLIFPLGISFIIFHCISYIVDIYGICVKKCGGGCETDIVYLGNEFRVFTNFSTYILFFPKLIQGPIVSYNDMKNELENRHINLDMVSSGVSRFIIGLSKKVLLADSFGNSLVLINRANVIDTPTAWLSVLLYGLQLYFDFSGYSDMAIGLSKMVGFNYKENFNFPYISTSVSEFWRRWHISLGAWFRNYVYIPLGGNRTGSVYVNLFIVFLLTGIWHGNTWIYVCWGVAMGIAVLIERTEIYNKIMKKLPCFKVIGWIYTMLFVFIGWTCFRVKYVSDFIEFAKVLCGGGTGELTFTWRFFLTGKITFLIIISCIGMWAFSRKGIISFIDRYSNNVAAEGLKCFLLLFMFVLCFVAIVSNGYTPFLYFQF